MLKTDIIHKLKFYLWYYSKKNIFIEKPINLLGKISTLNFLNNYKKKIKKKFSEYMPVDRYERENSIPKQFYIIKDDKNSTYEMLGLKILMNHFRIPFTEISLKKFDPSLVNNITESIFLISIQLSSEKLKKITAIFSNKIEKIINFGSIDFNRDNISDNLCTINNNPEELLPFNMGLRSLIVEKFTDILLSSKKPIITGFMPPHIGIRIDDVMGKKIDKYLPILLKHNWKPNLGIFTDSFKDYKNNITKYISSQNNLNNIEISPHAYNVRNFIFHNYSNGKPLTEKTFKKNWNIVKEQFKKCNFTICPVLNAHFHAFSKECFDILKKNGIKYIYSEFAPSKIMPIPNKKYLPSGDPINTTGQASENIIQVYSGDSVMCCNQKNSYYDFLMHTKNSNKINNAFNRIVTRLNLSLKTGFASFFTTHEYLLNKLNEDELSLLFEKIDSYIVKSKFSPVKTSLSEIGRNCENHTNIIIYSIKKEDNKYSILVKGKSNGDFYLSSFGNGKINFFKFDSFTEKKVVEIFNE